MALSDPHIELVIQGQIYGQRTITVRYYRSSAVPTLGDLLLVGSVFAPLYEAEMIPLQSEDWSLVGLRWRSIIAGTFSAPFEFVTATPGTVAGASVATQSALVVTVRTITGGPKWRGRIFTPGMPRGELVDGEWSFGQAENVREAWENLMEFNAGTPDYTMQHVTKNGSASPAAWENANIIAMVGRRNPGVMRSRRIGTGI